MIAPPRRALVPTLLLLSVIGLSSCTSAPEPPEPSPSTAPSIDSADVIAQWQASESKASLTIEAGGAFWGYDDCNTVEGFWNIDGQRIDLDFTGGTEMACTGIDVWLSAATTADLHDDVLTLFDETGVELGILEKVE